MQDWRYTPEDVLEFLRASIERRNQKLGSPVLGPGPWPNDGSGYWVARFDDKVDRNFGSGFWPTLRFMCMRLDQHLVGLDPLQVVRLSQAVHQIPADCEPSTSFLKAGGDSPAYTIREILQKCRPGPADERFQEIGFLKALDSGLYGRCQRALSEAQDALGLRHYASATVVAVFVLEALVSWWLRQPQSGDTWPKDKQSGEAKTYPVLAERIKSCKASLFSVGQGVDGKDRPEIEHLLGKCLDAASLRNLIHADKAERSSCDIDAAVAHSAMGAVLSLAQRIGTVLAQQT